MAGKASKRHVGKTRGISPRSFLPASTPASKARLRRSPDTPCPATAGATGVPGTGAGGAAVGMGRRALDIGRWTGGVRRYGDEFTVAAAEMQCTRFKVTESLSAPAEADGSQGPPPVGAPSSATELSKKRREEKKGGFLKQPLQLHRVACGLQDPAELLATWTRKEKAGGKPIGQR